MIWLLNKLFEREDIGRANDGVVYLNRWTVLRTNKTFWLWKLFGLSDIRLYLHKFLADDCTSLLHDHPNDCISFVFKHGYVEEYWDNREKVVKCHTIKAPCLRRFAASHTHRVLLLDNKTAWSLIFMWPKTKEWGFFVEESGKRKRVHWRDFFGIDKKIRGCE